MRFDIGKSIWAYLINRVDPKSLWSRYIFALVLIFSLLLISHGLSVMALQKSGGDEELVNVSGKQRMLSQRILPI
ncbi:MAG: type IV pili methyl-accepting chemotaxis transducer N-terminal domain-containing protein [Pseudomonadota bacterium]